MTYIETMNIHLTNQQINYINGKHLDIYPIIYILRDDLKTKAYIGETIDVKQRMKQHLKNKDKKNLRDAIFVYGERLHKSATLNIETKLINYFLGDQKYTILNKAKIGAERSRNYYQKKIYENEIFPEIWEKLRDLDIVNNTKSVIENRDIFKLSPFKELTSEQENLKEHIIDFCQIAIQSSEEAKVPRMLFISGEAGTGKSVVLNSTFNTIQELVHDKEQINNPFFQTDNYLLVNHKEMLKAYHTIAKLLPNLYTKNFMKPTTFINEMDKKQQKANIVFIDEAHLLLSKKDSYNNFHYDNQLDEIIKRANIVVCMYDQKQVLKMKSYWDKNLLQKIKKSYKFKEFELTEQFRMRASDKTINWINNFVNKKIFALPDDEAYDLRFFSSLEEMHKTIKEKNHKYGLSRMVSTFDYIHKKDGKTYYVSDNGYKLPWNRDYKKTWAEESKTIKEIGSIYTIQGFDLNYVGVHLGPSITFNKETKELVIDIHKYCDTEAFRKNELIPQNKVNKVKEEIILNSLNVLMKRGVKGLYIHASNPDLNEYLLNLQNNKEAQNSL